MIRRAAAACLLVLICSAVRAQEAPRFSISAPAEILQGEIAQVEVTGAKLADVEGRFGKEKIPFYRNAQGYFIGLLGVDLEAKPAPAKFHVRGTTSNGLSHEREVPLRIKTKPFPREDFSVAPQFDQLTPEVLERIRREQEQFAHAFASSVPARLWQRPFTMPVSMDVSSPFGYRRVINGTPRAPHTGVDLKAPMGTEVAAVNNGRVALIGDFFYSGNSIVLDHGGGLYTVYFHLSEIKVEEGAEIRKGDVIGLSGMTGRVTGPHLHWGARLNGARIDPFELVRKLGGTAGKPVGTDTKTD